MLQLPVEVTTRFAHLEDKWLHNRVFAGHPRLGWIGDYMVELPDQLHPRCEEALGKRLGDGTVCGLRILVEELKILAKIEDVEKLLVLPRAEQVWAQPSAATEHLPELRLRADDLEEDQVH